MTRSGDEHQMCRVVVIASGARHAVRSDSGSAALTLYFGLQTPQGIALNALSHTRGQDGDVWVVRNGRLLAEAMAASLVTDGASAATDFLVGELCGMPDPGCGAPRSVHPQLRQAIEFVSSQVPEHVDVASVATAVALSPDYLGRLCKQQTGVSFSATIRWVRLLTSLRYIAAGMPVTDAAHLAGFADGSHANRVCWEMTGAPPQNLARELRDSQFAAPTAR
ncbi:MAG: helix-turn-helix transcriptional regulator [Mycobacterium sp.]|nr:helix-turn-helix transcriptional regulator [Mycobacterium sp.]